MEALTCFPPNRTPRWSNNMPQYSLLCLNRKAKPLVSKIYPNYAIKRDQWRQWNTKNIPKDLRKLVYHYLKQKAEEATTTGKVAFTALPTTPGGGEEDSRQSPVEEFDYSIIIWYIATAVWYYTDKGYIPDGFLEKCKSMKQISRYMMYLLVDITSGNIEAQYGETHRVVLENAGDLVLQMNNSQQSFTKKWDTIGCAWLEMLAYAASRCKANQHSQTTETRWRISYSCMASPGSFWLY
ncbi:hypothetical protein QYF36_004693 [Acer negundo]|nr:hypothetical protein QYF36_004693 [Acer negundo]